MRTINLENRKATFQHKFEHRSKAHRLSYVTALLLAFYIKCYDVMIMLPCRFGSYQIKRDNWSDSLN